MFRRIETLPFARGVLGDVRPALDQPRPPQRAATPSTRCPTRRSWRSTSATCRARSRARSWSRSGAIAGVEVVRRSSARRPTCPAEPVRDRALRSGAPRRPGGAMSVGRDGASDAISFLEAGVPGGRVRARRRRPPRPRGVGLDPVAGALPAGARGLHARRAAPSVRSRGLRRRRGRAGVSVGEDRCRAPGALDGQARRSAALLLIVLMTAAPSPRSGCSSSTEYIDVFVKRRRRPHRSTSTARSRPPRRASRRRS